MKSDLFRFLLNAICGYLIASVISGVFLITKNNEWGNPIAIEILQVGFAAQAVFWVPLLFILRRITKNKSTRKTMSILLISIFATTLIVCGFFGFFLNY